MTKHIEVSEETYEKIKDQISEQPVDMPGELRGMVGQSWFFRTVTYHCVGRVKHWIEYENHLFLILESASWVADSGRFMNAIKDGTLSEVEPVGDMLLNLATVVDAFPWRHALPTKQK